LITVKKYIQNFKGNILIAIVLLALPIASCKKFVTEDIPNNQLFASAIFQDSNSLTAALNGVYATISSINNTFTQPSLFADELTSTNTGGLDFYAQNNSYTQDQDFGFSGYYYSAIYQANAILLGIDNATSLPVSLRNQVKGECLFLRAFSYFQLVNFYGGVPLIKVTDPNVTATIGNSSAAIVYQSIIADLTTAATLVPNTYAVADRTRANLQTVNALLAKACLYTQNWANAETAATAVIGSGLYTLPSDLNTVFVSTGTETIWQWWNQQGYSIGINYVPFTTSFITYAARPGLVNAFDATDRRKNAWLQAGTGTAASTYYPYKWKLRTTTTGKIEYMIQLRLGEIYLIRAEARAQQNNLTGGLADLYMTRNRAGLMQPLSITTSAQLLDAVAQERRKELMFEAGNRWFDLNRTGQMVSVISAIKPNIDTHLSLLPFTRTTLLNNANLKQNPGY
jgi:hypothetical protein